MSSRRSLQPKRVMAKAGPGSTWVCSCPQGCRPVLVSFQHGQSRSSIHSSTPRALGKNLLCTKSGSGVHGSPCEHVR